MNNWPAIVLPLDISGTGYSVDPADFSAMFLGTAEVDAEAHWLFGSDNPGLTDLIAGAAMTPRLGFGLNAQGSGYTSAPAITWTGTGQTIAPTMGCTLTAGAVTAIFTTDPGSPDATAAGTINFSGGGGSGAAAYTSISPAPTLQSGYLSLADAATKNLNGLAAPIDVSNNQTVCAVVKRKANANNTLVIGNWVPAGSNAQAMVLLGSTGYVAYSRTASGNFAGDPQAIAPPAGSVGDWLFVAMTHTLSQRSVQWGNGSTYTEAGTLNVANALHSRVGIGGALTTYAGGLDCAEFIVFPRALSSSEITAVYGRSAARLAARSITLL